jgi:hypothetical protein
MKIEPASNLGNSCRHLGLEPDVRVSYTQTTLGVIVWDLEAEMEIVATWPLTLNIGFKTQEEEPKIAAPYPKLIPDRDRDIINDEFLQLRDIYRSPSEQETVESELAYRTAVGILPSPSRGVREEQIAASKGQ